MADGMRQGGAKAKLRPMVCRTVAFIPGKLLQLTMERSQDHIRSRLEEPKRSQFSIDSILLSKSSSSGADEESSNDESYNSAFDTVPPSTQSLKARIPKHGLTSPEAGHHSHGGKRARTIFTTEQLEKMEREFHKQQYVVGHERMYLANALNLTEAQVKVWFQNRRIKWRKQHMLSEQTRLHTLTDDPRNSNGSTSSSQIQHDPQNQLDQLN